MQYTNIVISAGGISNRCNNITLCNTFSIQGKPVKTKGHSWEILTNYLSINEKKPFTNILKSFNGSILLQENKRFIINISVII